MPFLFLNVRHPAKVVLWRRLVANNIIAGANDSTTTLDITSLPVHKDISILQKKKKLS